LFFSLGEKQNKDNGVDEKNKRFKVFEANESFTQQRVSLPEVIYTKERLMVTG